MKIVRFIFLNAMVVTLISVSLSAQPMPKNNKLGLQRHLLIENLDLSENQREAISELKFKNERQAIDYHAEIRKNQLTIDQLLRNDNPDTEAILELVEKNGQLRSELELDHVRTKLKVHEILTPEQNKELKVMKHQFGPKGGPGKIGFQKGMHFRKF